MRFQILRASLGVLVVAPAPFILSLTTTQQEYKTGAEVRVQIKQKNISSETITTAESNASDQAEFHYELEVLDAKGKLAPEAEYGRLWHDNGRDPKHVTIRVGSDIIFPLKPGESSIDEFVVTKFFDLSRPGKYTIQATRQVPREPNIGVVRSNRITITIVM